MKPIQKYAYSISAAVLSALPSIAAAQSNGTSLKSPTSFTNIQDFVAAFLKAIVQISLPILTLFIVYAGFLFVSARGRPEQISKARQNLFYVLIGATLILGAWMLATLIGGTVSQVVGTS